MFKLYKVALAVLLVVALLVVFGCAPPPVGEEEEEIEEVVVGEEKTATIGILGSLTGPLRSIAGSVYGIEDYMTYINEKGGIEYLDPKTGKTEHLNFRWIMGDMAWDSAKCISLYERFKAGGAIWMFCNGSVPSASIYALMARDYIPGVATGCTGEPCYYEIEKPYLLAQAEFMPHLMLPIEAYYIQNVWDKPGTPKMGHLAADVGSRRIMELPEVHFYEAVEQLGGELLPIEFIPIAPIDLKIQISRLVGEGANLISCDHWGEGAIRVFMHNAIDLKLWEKDIVIWQGGWIDPKISLAEPDVWNTYNEMGGKLLASTGGWAGSQAEYDKYADKYPGLRLAFDLCKKYRGCLPEEMGGGYYTLGVKDGMILEMVFKKTLEKYGYEGLTGETLRETFFGLEEVIDSGGLYPPFIIDYEGGLPCVLPHSCIVTVKDGHVAFDPEVYPWTEGAPVYGKTRFNPHDPRPEWNVWRDYMEPIL